jgi:ABC-type Fe3+ transport system substrate-binding protein
MPTPKLNKILIVLYALATIGVLIAAFISPTVRAIAYAPLRDLIIPPPRPIVVDLLYSTEKAEWLDEVMVRFEGTRPTLNGRPIELTVEKMGSREMYLSILNEEKKPDLMSPASMLQISLLQDLSASKFGQPFVNRADAATCRPVLRSPIVLVAWEERADILWGDNPNGKMWWRLREALIEPQGWEAYGRPEWGYIKFGHTTPLKSNSGLQTILLMTYNYFGTTDGLTAGDVLSDEDYQEWFITFEDTISQFGDSTGTYMEEIVAYGPSLYDFVSVYEATAIEEIENAVGRYGELRVYYPPATSVSDHPFCVLQADWVRPENAEAAQIFLDYLTSREAQTLALDHGFRPVDDGIPLDQPGSPFLQYADNGINTEIPPEVEVPPGNVLNTLLEFWARNVER